MKRIAFPKSVGTLLYLGECYERTGMLASARATFEAATSERRNANDAHRAKTAAVRAAALVGRLPKLQIVMQSHHGDGTQESESEDFDGNARVVQVWVGVRGYFPS